MISWNCSGPKQAWWADNQQTLISKTPSIRFSILYPLRHSLIIIFTLHILLLYLYISHIPFTRAILVVDYYGVLALLAHRVRPFRERFWFIIVDDIILIRCKLLGCVMHVAICSPVIVSDVFLLAREQISDYKEVLDTDSNYYVFFPSISRINLIVIAPIFLYFPLFA